jgi:hypothetical protein
LKPIIFPSVTQTTDFAVVGYDISGPVIGDGFSVRYDAAQQVYVIDTPVTAAGTVEGFHDDADSWIGRLGGSSTGAVFDILKPASSNPASDFQFTSLAPYYEYEFGGPFASGALAFGTATPSAAIPTTGSAVYDAILSGFTAVGDYIGGTATLQFDFGAGTLAGSLSPVQLGGNGFSSTTFGTYTFVNTVFSPGSTTFSGNLQTPGIADLGSFNGLFTGPAAQELMARWRAPYMNGQTQSEIAGVLIGRKP